MLDKWKNTMLMKDERKEGIRHKPLPAELHILLSPLQSLSRSTAAYGLKTPPGPPLLLPPSGVSLVGSLQSVELGPNWVEHIISNTRVFFLENLAIRCVSTRGSSPVLSIHLSIARLNCNDQRVARASPSNTNWLVGEQCYVTQSYT